MKQPLTIEQQFALASQVFDCAYKAFESFEDKHLGADIAYLIGAILDPADKGSGVDWTTENYPGRRPELLEALRAEFPADSPLWGFITLDEPTIPKFTTSEEIDVALARLTELGLIEEVV